MKKQLLTTTALAVAGALVMSGPIFVMASGDAFAQAKKKKATKPVFTLGGGWETTFGFADQEEKVVGDKTGFDVHNSTEVYFAVNHLLDNGIKIKGRVELEGQTSTDQVDEAYFAISGAFGEVRIGSEDPVTDLMVGGYSGNKATGVGHNTNLSLDDWISAPAGHTAGRTLDIDAGFGDAEKIAYFTPRIEGLQLGVSYMPNGEKDASSAIPNNSVSVHDGWALAANYTRKIDKIAIGVAVGYVTGKAAAGTNLPENDIGDPSAYTAGLRLKFGGATVAAGYTRTFNRRAVTDDSSKEVLSLGANYKWGANAVSIGWLTSEAPGVNETAGEDESELVNVAYARELGPGVSWRTNLMFADYDGEDATVTTDDTDGWALVTGLKLSF